MIALYAITDHPTPPLPDPDNLRVVASGDLAAVCGTPDGEEMTAEALWRHERIVEALMDDRDVLPVRYGTLAADDAAAVRALEDNRARFTASLESVRGAVELAVRVFSALGGRSAPTPTARAAAGTSKAATGTEYLRARARAAAAESEAITIVHEPLAREARADTVARVNRPGELLRAAYLVDRDAVSAFSARVHEIQEGNPQLRLTCTGPWPPYSFVTR